MGTALFAVGLVLVVEGLAWALAPSAIEAMLEALRRLGLDQRRMIGLGAIALGVAFIWAAQALGA